MRLSPQTCCKFYIPLYIRHVTPATQRQPAISRTAAHHTSSCCQAHKLRCLISKPTPSFPSNISLLAMCIRAVSWQCATSSQLPTQCTVFDIWIQSPEANVGGFAVEFNFGALKGNAGCTDSTMHWGHVYGGVGGIGSTDSVLDECKWSPSTPVTFP